MSSLEERIEKFSRMEVTLEHTRSVILLLLKFGLIWEMLTEEQKDSLATPIIRLIQLGADPDQRVMEMIPTTVKEAVLGIRWPSKTLDRLREAF